MDTKSRFADTAEKQEVCIQPAILDPTAACDDKKAQHAAGDGVTERVLGYQRKTNRLPYPNISKEFPGKVDTSTRYVIEKVVSRLEMDSRWALARAVRAFVAERDAFKQKLDSIEQLDSANG